MFEASFTRVEISLGEVQDGFQLLLLAMGEENEPNLGNYMALNAHIVHGYGL